MDTHSGIGASLRYGIFYLERGVKMYIYLIHTKIINLIGCTECFVTTLMDRVQQQAPRALVPGTVHIFMKCFGSVLSVHFSFSSGVLGQLQYRHPLFSYNVIRKSMGNRDQNVLCFNLWKASSKVCCLFTSTLHFFSHFFYSPSVKDCDYSFNVTLFNGERLLLSLINSVWSQQYQWSEPLFTAPQIKHLMVQLSSLLSCSYTLHSPSGYRYSP